MFNAHVIDDSLQPRIEKCLTKCVMNPSEVSPDFVNGTKDFRYGHQVFTFAYAQFTDRGSITLRVRTFNNSTKTLAMFDDCVPMDMASEFFAQVITEYLKRNAKEVGA